jgi:hypothetical protein
MTLLGDKRNAAIRTLNDAFRGAGGLGGRVLFTAGVSDLGVEFSHLALGLVRKLFWKIDYYDKALEYGSDDPADPGQTTRVLTIMLAEEY